MLEPLLRAAEFHQRLFYLSDTWADIWSSSLSFCCIITATSNILLAFLIATTAYCLPGTVLTPSKWRTVLLRRRTVMLFPFKSIGQTKCFFRHQRSGGKKHPLNVISSEIHLSKISFLMRAPTVTPWLPQSPPCNPVHHHRHWFWETSEISILWECRWADAALMPPPRGHKSLIISRPLAICTLILNIV